VHNSILYNMTTIEFIYRSAPTIIQGKSKEKMKDIINKYLNKIKLEKNKLIFLYNGSNIEEELTLNQQIKDIDKKQNKMCIMVVDYEDEKKNESSIKKSKNIICPECHENIRIAINDKNISLYGCKNGHKIDKEFEEFENTQYIDESKIICEKCKINNKNEVFENKFFFCFKCKLNLCPLCKNTHDKSHNIIDYDNKYYTCNEHYEPYTSYCKDCNKDLCTMCGKEHKSHKTVTYGWIMPDLETLKEEIKKFKIKIDELKTSINIIITKLNTKFNELIKNLDIRYKIYNNIINNFENQKRNYPKVQNMNEFEEYISRVNKLKPDDNIINKFDNLLDLFDPLIFKDKINQDITLDVKEGEEIEEEDDNNEEEVIKFNPSDNKYENFQINKLKIIEEFETKYQIKFMLILQDRRILTYQEYYNEDGDNKYRYFVYNPKKKFKCTLSIESKDIDNMFLMDDGNILIKEDKFIKVIQIKKKSIETIEELEDDCYNNIYKISGETIITRDGADISIYSYDKGKLTYKEKKETVEDINDLCRSKKDEIAIYYYKSGKLYGYNCYVLFYNFKSYEKAYNLKLGNGEGGNYIKLINKDTLILDRNKKIIVIDVNNRSVIKEVKITHRFTDNILVLNDNMFIMTKYGQLYIYEINNFNLRLKEEKTINNDLIGKYPENKIYIANDKKIMIYGEEDLKEKKDEKKSN